jgi:hypothetical protein
LLVLYRPRSVAVSLLAFILCLFLELRSDGAAEVVTVRNCYMYSLYFFDVVVAYNYIWSVVMENSISYGPSIGILQYEFSNTDCGSYL